MCIYLYLQWANTSLMCFMPSLQIDLIAELFTSRSVAIHKLANIDALIVSSNNTNIILTMVPLTRKFTIQCECWVCHSQGNFPLHFECSLNLFTLTAYSQVISITCECNHSIHFLRALHEWNVIHAFKLTLWKVFTLHVVTLIRFFSHWSTPIIIATIYFFLMLYAVH